MDSVDQKRIDHADQTIKKGSESIHSDFKTGYYWIWSGHMLKAATLLKNNHPETTEVISSLIVRTKQAFAGGSQTLHLEKQNELIWLALFVGDLEGARSISKILTDPSESHPFQVSVNYYLHQILGTTPPASLPNYQPASSESDLLSEFEKLLNKTPTSLNGTDAFWLALRKKRFANTIHEHTNIFRPALELLRRA